MRLINASDLHLRGDKPRCRLDDDWESFQANLLMFIVNKANEYKCDLILDGDIFDTYHVLDRIVNMAIAILSTINKKVYFIVGNHDLLGHNINNLHNSSAGIIRCLSTFHTKIDFDLGQIGQWADFNSEIQGKETGLLFIHQQVYKNRKDMPPNTKAFTASELLEKYPDVNWIFTGDMHHSFHYEKNGRHVINPGCINRQDADMINYQPIIYFVDTDKNIVEEIELPDNAEMVTDEYLKDEKKKVDRISAFVEGIKIGNTVSLDFIKNINKAIIKSNLDEGTKSVVEELIQGGNINE
jgi:DNA repair exonuclease SbcCD nuclease subunit